MTYKVKLEIFEGPLDLLFYLIKKDELNIHDIPILSVTEQYLQYLELMRMLDLDIAGEFLVMAATLIHIKSKMLLPPDAEEAEKEEEDPREELVKKLLEYKKFREAAEALKEREHRQKEIFPRSGAQDIPEDGMEGVQAPCFEASIFDLLSAFSKVLKEIPRDKFYEVVKDEVTVADKIHDIFHMLLKTPVIYFFDLFKQSKTKVHVVATFLALLELIRMKEVAIKQDGIFGDIRIIRNSTNMAPPKIEEAENAGREDPGQEGPAGSGE
ncbi:MAG: segregation/condensation protein A [Candidatus Omnitrophica bacterium]|nr:segregation/condensation protein A [Candidatus Omnitrophota bacterium]